MSANVKFLGTTDEVTTCDCCGRSELKSTVALSIDEGEPVYFGVTCAAHALLLSEKEVRSESRKADREKEAKELRERDAKAAAAAAPWLAFLRANGTGDDVFRQIESLGGYKAARAKFQARQS